MQVRGITYKQKKIKSRKCIQLTWLTNWLACILPDVLLCKYINASKPHFKPHNYNFRFPHLLYFIIFPYMYLYANNESQGEQGKTVWIQVLTTSYQLCVFGQIFGCLDLGALEHQLPLQTVISHYYIFFPSKVKCE